MSTAARNALRGALHQLIGDKYEILHWIGGGGMAEVFLAQHRTTGGLFAVKVLSESLAQEPRVVARFVEEARTAATLSGHPNIVPIFDVGEGCGLNFLIMPYVDGEDVKHVLERQGRLGNDESACIVMQVAEALIWASDRGVVHRDLKPANIRIDRSGRALVLDFGIAKAQDVPTGLTSTGETLGTPYYMSPEQIRAEACDVRSDLYSLGVMFFELLSGLKPFTGDTYRAIEVGHTSKQPPALSSLVEGVAPELEQVVNRLLEKRPEDRYQTPRELLAVLKALPYGRDTVLQAQPDRQDLLAMTVSSQQTGSLPLMGGAGGSLRNDEAGRDEGRDAQAPQVERKRLELVGEPRRKKGRGWAPLVGVVGAGIVVLGIWVWWQQRAQPLPEQRDTATALAPVIRDEFGEMVLIPAGTFVFGDDAAESPNKKRVVHEAAFYIDSTEVSNADYTRFAEAENRSKKWDTEVPLAAGTERAEAPVSGVTYEEATRYCQWAGKQLPTEEQWEKAARGTDGRVYPWGSEEKENPGVLVGVKALEDRRSPYGVLHMSGNVFEWTISPFPVTQREVDDFTALGGKPVSDTWQSIKGGSFLIKDGRFLRVYMRRGWPWDRSSPALGFRCVKAVPPTIP